MARVTHASVQLYEYTFVSPVYPATHPVSVTVCVCVCVCVCVVCVLWGGGSGGGDGGGGGGKVRACVRLFSAVKLTPVLVLKKFVTVYDSTNRPRTHFKSVSEKEIAMVYSQ